MRVLGPFILIFLLVCSIKTTAQKTDFTIIEKYLSDYKLDSAETALNKINISSLKGTDLANYYVLKGTTKFSQSRHDEAFENFIKGRKIYMVENDPCKIASVNLLIIEVLSHQSHPLVSHQSFLEEYLKSSKICGKPIDEAIAHSKLAVVFLSVDNAEQAIYHFNRGIEIANTLNDSLWATNLTFNKGVVYNTTLKKYDSALYFFKQTQPFYVKIKNPEYLSYNYNNQAEAYKKLHQFKKATDYYRKADSIPLRKYNLKTKRIYYENMADLYHKMNQYDTAYLYAQKLLKVKDSINEMAQNVSMAEIKEQYDNEKLRADNLEIESKRTQNRNIAFALGGGMFGVSVIGWLLFKNTKRKQRIAEQQREIEIQKTEKLLKEQELNTIDAMLAGQEKERERLASDLHDSVGATLAAAKLQFDHLRQSKGTLKNDKEIFEKTSALLEDAYLEVRSLAHLKNSGVIAKEGLLPAVLKLANNASQASNIQFDVQDFGLVERIENSLEITIFRIIQELVTNIIKHSQATEASISITQFDYHLNIIVEDNGKGIETRIPHSQGMGLSNIERRVEGLEGTMEVDSTEGKGTTILIDIPI